MSKANVLDVLHDIGMKAISSVEISCLELVDIEFTKEAGRWYLRYYIDRPTGVNLEDCQAVSNEISRLLDSSDPISHGYILEVSSPGIERPLKKEKDFLRFMGSQVEVKTYMALGGKKVFNGTLVGFSDEHITIKDGDILDIPRDKVSSAKLKYNWNGA